MSAAPEPAEAQPQAQAASAAAHHRLQQRLDPAAALLQAAYEESLSPTQRSTVGTVARNLEATGRALAEVFRGVGTDLAAQVRAGVLDPAHVSADESAITDAVQAHVAQEVDALGTLHTILAPTQRKAAVTVLSSERPGSAELQADPEALSGRAARLDRLTRELGLDSDQQQRVAALLAEEEQPAAPDRAEHERRFEQVVGAFASDTFDARATFQSIAPSPVAMIHERVQRQTAFLSQLLPILRPAQRETLASIIESGEWRGGERDQASQGGNTPKPN
ncbi:MAG: hypothetical protein JOZ69_00255 [Myxococcales bacterium]|nr:hypothetical protein [Myxococcales bacterium]